MSLKDFFLSQTFFFWKQGKNDPEMKEWWGHINCHILDPAAFITDNVSLYITCYDVVYVTVDLLLAYMERSHNMSVRIMLDTPAPEATAQKCYICPASNEICSDWHCLSTEEYTPTLITHCSQILHSPISRSLHVCLVEGNQQLAHWL